MDVDFTLRPWSTIRMQTAIARGVGFEPTSSFEHGISNPTPYQARRPPPKLEDLWEGNILILIISWIDNKITIPAIGGRVHSHTMLKRLLNGDPWLY
jgi:hypothetical protein